MVKFSKYSKVEIPIVIRNPYILFSPFLIAFIIYVLISPPTGTSGDESRYIYYAHNLIHGFYSPPPPDIKLINGPGYPLLLVPFIALNTPLVIITLMNAFFYYFSIILLFNALKGIVSFGAALSFSFVWAFYYVAYQSIPFIHTETFTYLLISMLIYTILKAFNQEITSQVKKYVILSGFIFGYIVLTKMIFGYVLLIMLIGSGLLWISDRKNLNYRKSIIIMLVSLTTVLPYLIYTYQLTGKIFYLGNQNDSLYWMSTPVNGEYGSWFPDQEMDSDSNYFTYYIPSCKDSIIHYHGKEIEAIHSLTGIDKDEAYGNFAIRNIREHPYKYIQNVIYNTSRLLFQFPSSYGIHRPKIIILFPINGFLLTIILFSMIPTYLNWRRIPFSVRFLFILAIIYLGGSILVPAQVRMFAIIVPILLAWIAFIFQNTFKINLRFKGKND